MKFWGRVEAKDSRRVIVPASAYDARLLDKVRTGADLTATLKWGRNGKRERWYWGFVELVADGIGMDKQSLHARIKFAADRVEAIIDGQDGPPVVLLQSTSREAMDDARFAEYVDQAVEIVFRLYLPEVRRKDVLAEVNRMVGFERPL